MRRGTTCVAHSQWPPEGQLTNSLRARGSQGYQRPRFGSQGPQARRATCARLLHSPNLDSLRAQSTPLGVYKALKGHLSVEPGKLGRRGRGQSRSRV